MWRLFLGVSQSEVNPPGRPGAGESGSFLGTWGWAPTGVWRLRWQTWSLSPHSELGGREGFRERRERSVLAGKAGSRRSELVP